MAAGLPVLGWIRRQPEFNHVPVIILVDGADNKSVQQAFDRGANAYYLKRDDFEALARMVRGLETIRSAKGTAAHQRASSTADEMNSH